MPDFDWEEYLELAEELVKRRGNPAAERSGISRAYYAAFHTAANYFSTRGQRLTLTGTDHREVWDWFRLRTDEVEKSVGSNGRALVGSRRKADYEVKFEGLSSEAEYSVIMARAVVNDVRHLIGLSQK